MCTLSRVWLFEAQWTVACQAHLSMGFSRQKYWGGLPFPTPGDLHNPGIEPASLGSPALAGRFFTVAPPGKFKVKRSSLWYLLKSIFRIGLPWWYSGKVSAFNAGVIGDVGLIFELGRSPGGGNGNPLQYSCLGNPRDRGAWQAIVDGVTNNGTWQKWLSTHTPSGLWSQLLTTSKISFSAFSIYIVWSLRWDRCIFFSLW